MKVNTAVFRLFYDFFSASQLVHTPNKTGRSIQSFIYSLVTILFVIIGKSIKAFAVTLALLGIFFLHGVDLSHLQFGSQSFSKRIAR